MKKVLFVTWDGEAQSYLTSLFFPIFGRLRDLNVDVHVLQFSFAGEDAIERTRASAERHELTYIHRRTPARFRTPLIPAIACWGAVECARYARLHDLDAFMPRSLVPAAMILLARRMTRDMPVIFDADGFMADERVDFAGWSREGAPYRALRAIESRLAQVSKSIIVRTEHARSILAQRVPESNSADVRTRTHVIPNLKDEAVFHPGTARSRQQIRRRLGLRDEDLLLASVGSLAPQYYPTEQARLVRRLLDEGQRVHWVILTGHQDIARAAVSDAGIPEQHVTIDRIPSSEIPQWVAAADVGLALREPAFSQRAVCPIKIGEYLLCGTPVLATTGVGDVESYIDSSCGLLLENVGEPELERAARWITDEVRELRETVREAARQRGVRIFAMANVESLYRPVFADVGDDPRG